MVFKKFKKKIEGTSLEIIINPFLGQYKIGHWQGVWLYVWMVALFQIQQCILELQDHSFASILVIDQLDFELHRGQCFLNLVQIRVV